VYCWLAPVSTFALAGETAIEVSVCWTPQPGNLKDVIQ
jgi:hypothetical protein